MIPMQPSPAGLPSRSFGGRHRHSASSGWLARLAAAPHRLGFLAGGTLLAVLALWWGAALVARAAGVPLPWVVNPGTAHALAFAFGFMPLFFTGFLFTAGPRWLGLPAVPGGRLQVAVSLMVLGWAAALAGFHLSVALAALGLAVAAVGFALATGLFGLMVLESRVADRDHPALVVLGCAVGAIALWVAAVAVALHYDAAVRAAVHAALWGCFGLVFATVAHRMIPFFTTAAMPRLDAWSSRALLGLLAWLMAIQAPFAAAEALLGGSLPPDAAALRAAIELGGGAWLLWLATRWGLVQSLKFRMLAMLHMGFFWLGVAFTLGGVSHALMALSNGNLSLGLAPLHAFTMGYLGSTLLAMASRVAVGQSGRAVVADNWLWAMFWALQLGIVARVAAALWPAAGTPLTLFAAQCWLAALGAWILRHGGLLMRTRSGSQVE